MKEFISENPFRSALLLVLIVSGLYLVFFGKEKCIEPVPLEVQKMALTCSMELLGTPPEILVANACEHLERGPDCELTDEDSAKIEEYVIKYVDDCTKKKLERANMCTDKIQEYLSRE